MAVVVMGALLALAGGVTWIVIRSNTINAAGLLASFALVAVLLIACFVGLDGIAYRLTVDSEGIELSGLLQRRRLFWHEIRGFRPFRVRSFAGDAMISLGYQAVIDVDGSHQPRRLARNLFFAGHFVPPLMELGGQDLVKLLTKVRRQREGMDQAAPDSSRADTASG